MAFEDSCGANFMRKFAKVSFKVWTVIEREMSICEREKRREKKIEEKKRKEKEKRKDKRKREKKKI